MDEQGWRTSMSIDGSLGMFLTKKNLVISTNRKNLFLSKASQTTLSQIHVVTRSYYTTMVSLANTIPMYWPTMVVTCDVAGYSDDD